MGDGGRTRVVPRVGHDEGDSAAMRGDPTRAWTTHIPARLRNVRNGGDGGGRDYSGGWVLSAQPVELGTGAGIALRIELDELLGYREVRKVRRGAPPTWWRRENGQVIKSAAPLPSSPQEFYATVSNAPVLRFPLESQPE